jgi:iron complex outermembrane receptor protein
MSNRSKLLRGASACALIFAFGVGSGRAQEALPTIEVDAAARPSADAASPGFSKEKKALPVYREPTGQTFTTVDSKNFKNVPLFTAADLLVYSPGLSFKAGNGPRDVGISIRGSGARNGFGIRNIFMLEDGFPVTQPDGLGRADAIDPHAYSGVDVYRGPSSALFGNYANGGAINFRTFSGAEIDGFEYGNEFGSFGYVNNFLRAGKAIDDFDLSLFVSDVRGEGFIQHSQYDTQTINFKGVWSPTPTDKFTLKFVHNELYGNLAGRLSLNQFYRNPYQHGCVIFAAFLAPYCASVSVPLNGLRNPAVSVSADQAGFHRNDRRDIIGLRWEHDFDANTTWRTQAVYDDKDIDQPTGATKALNDVPSIQASSDITHNGTLFGMPARHWIGVFFGRARATSYTLNTLPYGNGAGGAITQKTESMISNISLRAREELALSPDVTLVLGLAGEFSRLSAFATNINYQTFAQSGVPANSFIQVPVDRSWWNAAPEASVTWRIDPQWQVYARASSGYGIPNSGQLFVNEFGQSGANTTLEPQRNTGFDAGFTWTPDAATRVTLNGFYEWYQNELLTQFAGTGLRSFTFNAPGSVHRGVEFIADWRPTEGWLHGWSVLANYTYNNQIFTNFVEALAPPAGAPAGTKFLFDRAGYRIPGVAPHELTARLGYDLPYGELKGLGGYVEYVYKYSYFVDNGNQLTIPSYGVLNLNLHYTRDIPDSFLKNFSAFVEVRNVFDRTYAASANNVTNTIVAAGFQNPGIVLANTATGSIYAGMPRAVQGGVKFKF